MWCAEEDYTMCGDIDPVQVTQCVRSPGRSVRKSLFQRSADVASSFPHLRSKPLSASGKLTLLTTIPPNE